MKVVSLSLVLVISLVLCSVVLEIVDAYSYPPPLPPPLHKAPPPPHKAPPSPLQAPPGVPSFCVPKCKHRCSRNPRELCKKLCIKCCAKCKCVPTGPKGDKAECPCYRDWFNKKGKPKCP